MKKVAIIGYYGEDGNVSDGQGVKTKIITEELTRTFNPENIQIVNTYNWKKNPLKLLYMCLISAITCKNIIFLTDENGIKVFPKLFLLLKKFFNNKIHYYVVGGWLPEYSKDNKNIRKIIQQVDCIYVELKSMQRNLQNQGFTNIIYVNKFRRLNSLPKDKLVKYNSKPYKLCTFSRVVKEKGIEDAIKAVKNVNNKLKDNVFELDIYGTIDESYSERFNSLIKEQPIFIQYKGVVEFERSTEVLKKYFAMLFPTYYRSEGYPNTVVDAFAAGLPVIASDFRYNAEVINSGEDGIIYNHEKPNELEKILIQISYKPNCINNMKKNSLKRCEEYNPGKAIQTLVNNLK